MNHVQAPGAGFLRKIAGFESSAFAYRDGVIVWTGQDAGHEHPRNAWRPWRPAAFLGDRQRLRAGARICLEQVANRPEQMARSLLGWLIGAPLPFPLNHARARFDAVRDALARNDIHRFEAAALRLLGLGHGLTPSGDDFVGGVMFALAHAPRDAWSTRLPVLKTNLRKAAAWSTNVISAALLDDLMDGASFSVLHAQLAALQECSAPEIESATRALLRVGASSGADMLAGLLLALDTMPERHPHPRPLPKGERARKSDPP
jgi:hypothetical protein